MDSGLPGLDSMRIVLTLIKKNTKRKVVLNLLVLKNLPSFYSKCYFFLLSVFFGSLSFGDKSNQFDKKPSLFSLY